MNYVFRSRFYREEILRWLLIGILSFWATAITVAFFMKHEKVIVIAVADDSSYVISTSNESHDKKELLSFVKNTVAKLYSFDEKSFNSNLTDVSNVMTEDLWNIKQPEYSKISEALKKTPLSQSSEILSIDQIDPTHLAAVVMITVRQKLGAKSLRLRVEMEVRKNARSETNPWMYELVGLKDAPL